MISDEPEKIDSDDETSASPAEEGGSEMVEELQLEEAEQASAEESQAEQVQVEEATPGEALAEESQAEQVQVEEAAPDEALAEESQVEQAQVEEAAPSEASAEESQAEQVQVEEAAPGEALAEESQVEQAQVEEAAPEKVSVEESKPERVPAKKTKAQKKDKETAAEEEPEEEKVIPELDDERANYPWYVVHAYSGYEMRAKLTLEERIRSAGVSSKFGNIIVPEEKVVELVRGEKKTSSRKFFPGYLLVQCCLDDETWHLVKDTPKITGFVGDSRNPAPITEAEVNSLVQQMEGGAQRPRPRVQFEQGDSIKVVDGPFADFNGTVDEVKPDKGKLRVLISIFGRNTPVELDFVQVEKV